MPDDIIDGYARLTPEEREKRAGDTFANEFRRQLQALRATSEERGRVSFNRWRAMDGEQTLAMLGDITERLGLGDVTNETKLADHAEAISAALLEYLLNDELWETFNA